jgi:glyoxylase-like metal-dependent hydrolase (beta-lactamase superfamily II)
MILEKLTVHDFAVNCFLVGCPDTHKGLVIDPGGDADLIIEKVQSLELDIKAILLTHGHVDHIGAVAPIQKSTGAEIYMDPADQFLVENAPMHAAMFGLDVPERFNVNHPLHDGEIFKIGDLEFSVLSTPGHSPGGSSFYCQMAKRVFVGDTLFMDSIGRSDLPGGDQNQLLDSIRSKIMVLPKDTWVGCGHGPDTTIERELAHNPFLQQAY